MILKCTYYYGFQKYKQAFKSTLRHKMEEEMRINGSIREDGETDKDVNGESTSSQKGE